MEAQQAWHMAPPGALRCDRGTSASRDQCDGATRHMASRVGRTPSRSMVVGSGGGCLDGGWGQVPIGCSAQSGGDWAAHYKTSGNHDGSHYRNGCVHTIYQLICSDPTCSCNHGQPATGSACNGGAKCASCSGGYHLSGHACQANVCTCNHGQKATGSACTNNGGAKCASCSGGYHLSGHACQANVCTCNHGQPATGSACTNNGGAKCASCSEGYHLSDHSCRENVCTCNSGQKATGLACTKNGAAICASCNGGYHLSDHACQENVCTCNDGQKATGADCSTNDKNICALCNTDFKLVNGTCAKSTSARSASVYLLVFFFQQLQQQARLGYTPSARPVVL